MPRTVRTRINTALGALYLVCLVSFTAALAHNHLQLITHELPLDYAESSMLAVTAVIAQGENPYSLEHQPSNINLYPALYNVVVAPLSRLLGNTFELHRVVSGIFIVLSCLTCFYLCRESTGTRSDSLAAAALLYAALLHYSTPIASPNSLGLFLFLLAIAIPWSQRFSIGSLAASTALGVIAFFSKQYFVACLGYVALYLFLAVSKQRAIYFGLASAAALAITLYLVAVTSPYFIDDTFFAVGAAAKFVASEQTSLVQFREFIAIYYPLLPILAAAMVVYFRQKGPTAGSGERRAATLNLREMHKPLLNRQPDFIWLCCACSTVIILLVLGTNPGNYLTYHFQFISPFLLAGTLALVSSTSAWRWPARLLVVLTMYNSFDMLPRDFSVNRKNWDMVTAEIARADDIYASSLVLREVMARGSPVYDNQHTRYFPFGQFKPRFFIRSNPEHRVGALWERHVERIQGGIKARRFDLVIIDNWMKLPQSTRDSAQDTQVLLASNYQRIGHYVLPLLDRPGGGPYKIQVWKPLDAPHGDAHHGEDRQEGKL